MTTTSGKIIGIVSFMNAAGAQEALLRLARQLRSRGHDMEVWFFYQEDRIHENEPGTRVLIAKPRLTPLEYARVFFMLVRALSRAKPDAVVGFLPLGNVFGMAAAALAGVRTRIASQRAPGNTFGTVMRHLDRVLGTLGIYTRIVCVSRAVEQSFARYPKRYRGKLTVVHNGIEWQRSPRSRQEARAALGLPQDSFIFAAIGRMKTQKNYPFLLRTIAATPGVTLAIAGDGLLRRDLERLARDLDVADRVFFLGALGREALRDLLAASDSFIQASLYEGQSNAVLEAMHQGMPILVSDIPEQRETLVDEETGEAAALLAPLDDVTAWQAALCRLRDDEELRDALARAATQMVARRFSLERMIDGFERAIFPPATARDAPSLQERVVH